MPCPETKDFLQGKANMSPSSHSSADSQLQIIPLMKGWDAGASDYIGNDKHISWDSGRQE